MSVISIHTADWILPIVLPPIENGAVATSEGRILQVGNHKDVCRQFSSGEVYHHGKGAIMPALVNAHTHLELSPLENLIGQADGFTDWLKNVVQKRSIPSNQEIEDAMVSSIDRLKRAGTILLGDISNTGISLPFLASNHLRAVVFLEVVGLREERAKESWAGLASILSEWSESSNPLVTLAAHSPYGVSRRYLEKVNHWGRTNGNPVSIHLAESEEEVLFLKTGRGPMRDFLEAVNAFDPSFKPPGLSPVAFLAELGFLDERTLCVHLVHLSDVDIEILCQKKVRVCICPLSNQRLNVGLAPVDKLIKAGLSIALGTDSLASNDDLNLFREMAYIEASFPKIDTHEILKMGTIHGAAALGMDKIVGSMESGKEAHLIFVALEDTSLSTPELGKAIIESAIKEGVSWI